MRPIWPLEPGQGVSQERSGFPAERREAYAFRVVYAACRLDGRLRRVERSSHIGDGDIFPCFSRAQCHRLAAVGPHRTQLERCFVALQGGSGRLGRAGSCRLHGHPGCGDVGFGRGDRAAFLHHSGYRMPARSGRVPVGALASCIPTRTRSVLQGRGRVGALPLWRRRAPHIKLPHLVRSVDRKPLGAPHPERDRGTVPSSVFAARVQSLGHAHQHGHAHGRHA